MDASNAYLVHEREMQEHHMKTPTTSPRPVPENQVECVGSLLVPSKDLQELSWKESSGHQESSSSSNDEGKKTTQTSPTSNLVKRISQMQGPIIKSDEDPAFWNE